jgi:hypothetical protein
MAELVYFSVSAVMAHPKGIKHAKNDNRCHGHDACDGVGVWAKRSWHRTAPGQTGGGAARGYRASRARDTG